MTDLDTLPPLADPRRRSWPRILAIDPGLEQSAWIVFATFDSPTGFVESSGITRNEDLLALLRARRIRAAVAVIEQIESYGMAVGRDVFETVRWAGRLEEACWPLPVEVMPRRTVKTHLCGSAKAKDGNVRQALLDRFGGDRVAKGTKAAPGPLYGIARDLWSALAIAVTFADQTQGRNR